MGVQGATLRLTLTGRTDRATVWNPTAHPYFNLADGGATPIDEHCLRDRGGALPAGR